MARGFDGTTNEYLDHATPPDTTYPFSFGGWLKSADVSNGATLLCIGSSSGDDRIRIIVDNADGGGRYNINGGNNVAFDGDFIDDDQWHFIMVVSASATDHRLYVDTNKVTSASDVGTDPAVANVSTGASVVGGSVNNPTNGSTAEVFFYEGVALDDTDAAGLAAGYSPLSVRPGNLALYMPLIREADRDFVGGRSFTANGTPTVSDHPRIIQPRPSIWIPETTIAGPTERRPEMVKPVMQPRPIRQLRI